MSEPSGIVRAVPGAVEQLTELLLPAMHARVAALGEEGSGAYNFYGSRLRQGIAFLPYEVALLDALIEARLPAARIDDVGCGWGQFVMLLAWCGARTLGYENDRLRYATARELLETLGNEASAFRRVSLSRRRFPPRVIGLGVENRLVITTNIVTDLADEVEQRTIRGLRRYRYAVVNLDRFCRMRGPDD
ncbi:MAG: hypothetical protein ACREFC_03905, partial [Stellaceae bacterium]